MNLFPAIDLIDNKCVRLTKGVDSSKIIFNENPSDQAIYFEQQGCKRIHVVDLDAAFGRKKVNEASIKNIKKSVNIPIQVGGGIRSIEDAKFLIDLQIDYLIIGSLSVTNIESVINIAETFSNRIYVSLDILNSKIMIKGWKEKTNMKTKDIFLKYNQSYIRGYVLTDIDRDGTLAGLDMDIIRPNLNLTQKKLIVGGGLNFYDDLIRLKNLNKKNLEGAIIGKSFYLGNIDLKKANKIIKTNA